MFFMTVHACANLLDFSCIHAKWNNHIHKTSWSARYLETRRTRQTDSQRHDFLTRSSNRKAHQLELCRRQWAGLRCLRGPACSHPWRYRFSLHLGPGYVCMNMCVCVYVSQKSKFIVCVLNIQIYMHLCIHAYTLAYVSVFALPQHTPKHAACAHHACTRTPMCA